MRAVLRVTGRALISGIFVNSGLGMLKQPERYAKLAAAAFAVPDEPMLARAYGGTMLAAGTSLALGIRPRLSAAVLALALTSNTYVGHAFWKAENEEARRPQLIHFLKNVGLLGGLLVVAGERRKDRT